MRAPNANRIVDMLFLRARGCGYGVEEDGYVMGLNED